MPRTAIRSLAVAAVATGAVAAPALAHTSDLGLREHVQSGGAFPVSVPGQHPRAIAGHRMPKGDVLASRKITLFHGEKRGLTLACPSGTHDTGAAFSGTGIAFRVSNVNHYIGFQNLFLSAYAHVHRGTPGHGTAYELCVPN